MELISRGMLLKVIHEEDIHTPDEMWKPAREWVEIIKAMPTVESRPRGKWIENKTNIGMGYSCSICGTLKVHKHNYCEECGADMRGEE